MVYPTDFDENDALVSQAEVDAAANAMYEAQLSSACNAIDSLTFDPMELPEFIQRLKAESDTAQVLIYYPHLDDRI
jgi:hypothetical protein